MKLNLHFKLIKNWYELVENRSLCKYYCKIWNEKKIVLSVFYLNIYYYHFMLSLKYSDVVLDLDNFFSV